MAIIKLPYGRERIEFGIPDEKLNGVLSSHAEEYKAEGSEEDIVKRSLQNPIASVKLGELAKDAERVLYITSDHTRPVPSKIIMPIMLEEIRNLNPSIEVKILVATGCHRPTKKDELVQKFGQDIVDNEEIIVHDSKDMANMVFKGMLPSGGELWLNSLVDWADLVVAEGFIEPHFFAGFSGGRKSILPGIASERTVLANHCSKFISSPEARTGNLKDNPIHEDMIFAVKAAKLKFILNVVLNGDKKIINSFAGHSEKAHLEGCAFMSQLSRVSKIPSDIAITSNGGYPLDQNIYQAVKGMTAAEASLKEGGVIIIASACEDGHGGEAFYRWFKDASGPEEVAKRIETIPQSETISDQWQAQIFARVLLKHKVIMVADRSVAQLVKDLYMANAATMEEALNMAYSIKGPEAKIVVIPDGVSVIVE